VIGRVITCSGVILCEIIVYWLVIVRNIGCVRVIGRVVTYSCVILCEIIGYWLVIV
jgi:hypothetical protein